jgi:hypothetical protein
MRVRAHPRSREAWRRWRRTVRGVPHQEEEDKPSRPWNLRTRRSATVAPNASKLRRGGGGKAAAAGGGQTLHPHALSPVIARNRSFSVALTREEMVVDFIAIRGMAPPRRPKKRSRAVVEKEQARANLSFLNLSPRFYQI